MATAVSAVQQVSKFNAFLGQGDLDGLRTLLKAHPVDLFNLNRENKFGFSVIQRLLLTKKPAENATSPDAENAAREKKERVRQIVELLVSAAGVELINTVTKVGTALHVAIDQDNAEQVRALLALGADHHKCNSQGWSPLTLALKRGSKEIIDMLVAKGLPDEVGISTVVVALKNNNLDFVNKVLSENRVNFAAVDKKGFSLAHICILEKRADYFRMFLEHATRLGVESAFLEVKTAKNCTLLHLACKACLSEVLEILLQHPNLDVNAQDAHGWTPLMYAVASNHTEIVKRLLQVPTCDINAKSNTSHTVLMISVSSETHDECTALLLERSDLNVQAADSHGWTALHVAARKGSAKVVRLLTANEQCDVNAITIGTGLSPLHIATKRADTDVIQALLDSPRCNPNIQTQVHKWTSMHIAARENRIQVFRMLRNRGADPLSPDSHGRTPVNKAFSKRSMIRARDQSRAQWMKELEGVKGVLPDKKKKRVSRKTGDSETAAVGAELDNLLEASIGKAVRASRFSRKKHSKLLYSSRTSEERVVALTEKLTRLLKKKDAVDAALGAAIQDAASQVDGAKQVEKLTRKLGRLQIKIDTVTLRLDQAKTSVEKEHSLPAIPTVEQSETEPHKDKGSSNPAGGADDAMDQDVEEEDDEDEDDLESDEDEDEDEDEDLMEEEAWQPLRSDDEEYDQ